LLNLTRQEKLVLIFLGAAALLGLAADLFFKNYCPAEKLFQSIIKAPPGNSKSILKTENRSSANP